MIILINVLDYQTYQYPGGIDINNVDSLSHERLASIQAFDFNAVTALDRQRYQYARGLAYALIDWLFKSFDFRDVVSGNLIEDARSTLWIPFLSQQVSAILHYKREAEKGEMMGAPGCTASFLLRQVELCFEDSELQASVEEALQDDHQSFAFPDAGKYMASRRAALSAPLGVYFFNDLKLDNVNML